jgi:thioredoxin 1
MVIVEYSVAHYDLRWALLSRRLAARGDMATIQSITDADFDDQVIKSPTPCVVLFSASWSGTAQFSLRVLTDFASDFESSVVIRQMDVDESPIAASRYGVATLPTLLLFVQGRVSGSLQLKYRKDDMRALFEKASQY